MVSVEHAPGGTAGSKSNPPFDERFEIDTDDDKIKEIYKHYRPPFETKVTDIASSEHRSSYSI